MTTINATKTLSITRWVLITGIAFSAAAVLVGAFGAHALQSTLSAKAMGWIDTGVTYQTTHALALIACGLLPVQPHRSVSLTAWLFIIGIFCFSGSLYLMALTGSTQFAIVTPIGGVCLLAGWVAFGVSAYRLGC